MTVDAANKKATIDFTDAVLNNTADLTALKGAIKVSTDGTNFSALGANDTVAIESGNVVVTFDTLPTSNTLKLQVAASALKDAAGAVNSSAITTAALDNLAPTAPTAVTLTPVGGTVVANTINSTNTSLGIAATITAGEATGGKAEFYVGTTKVGEDTSILVGDTSVTYTTADADPTNAELLAAIAAGGEVSVKLFDAAGNDVTSSVANPTLVRDVVVPTVVITDDKTNAVTTADANGGKITYTFTFSEVVTGFTEAYVTVTNGTKGTLTTPPLVPMQARSTPWR